MRQSTAYICYALAGHAIAAESNWPSSATRQPMLCWLCNKTTIPKAQHCNAHANTIAHMASQQMHRQMHFGCDHSARSTGTSQGDNLINNCTMCQALHNNVKCSAPRSPRPSHASPAPAHWTICGLCFETHNRHCKPHLLLAWRGRNRPPASHPH